MNKMFSENSALVALSGGVDSAVLLAKAKTAGMNLHAATVISEFTPVREISAAESLAKRFAVPWHPVHISILSSEDIRQNPPERCYLCKKRIMSEMQELAKHLHLEAVFDGTHADDIAEGNRPGIAALQELGIISPFARAKAGKTDILRWAAEYGIEAHPPSACLATRIPHGTGLTAELLAAADTAENILREGGVTGILRVRFDGTHAVVETAPAVRETAKIYEQKLKQLGITQVSYRDYSSGGA